MTNIDHKNISQNSVKRNEKPFTNNDEIILFISHIIISRIINLNKKSYNRFMVIVIVKKNITIFDLDRHFLIEKLSFII